MDPGAVLHAAYGWNHFVVRVTEGQMELHAPHLKAMTLYGRLISETTIVNVNISFTYNHMVRDCNCFLYLCPLQDLLMYLVCVCLTIPLRVFRQEATKAHLNCETLACTLSR